MGDQAYGKRVRVGGDVEDGSIQHVNNAVHFTLKQEPRRLKVAYTGTDPLPDTFKDGAQALADGKMGRTASSTPRRSRPNAPRSMRPSRE